MSSLPFPIYAGLTAAKTWLTHPIKMAKDTGHFLKTGILNVQDRPKHGLFFETHSHSDFSDGQASLAQIVDRLFEANVEIWSLTDHNNTKGFDKLASGEYDLNAMHRGIAKNGQFTYNVIASPDGRSLIVRRASSSGKSELMMLRSTELYTAEGEINVHGFTGELEPRRNLEYSVKAAINQGGWVVINHPDFKDGVRYKGGMNAILKAMSAADEERGVLAIEKNGTEIFPQNYSAVRAEIAAKQFTLPLVTSGDSHLLDMYGRSGIVFSGDAFGIKYNNAKGNIADAVMQLIDTLQFKSCLNYITPFQFKRFFFVDYKKD